MSQQDNNEMAKHFYRASAADFKKIPGAPIGYWISNPFRETFSSTLHLSDIASPKCGMNTGDNSRFLRKWYEVGFNDIGFLMESKDDFFSSGAKWVPYNKGGEYRRWFGNCDTVLRYDLSAYTLLGQMGNCLPSESFYFRRSITWSKISTRNFCVRCSDVGFVFDGGGSSAFPSVEKYNQVAGLLNSIVATSIMKIKNPTANIQSGDIASVPFVDVVAASGINNLVNECIETCRADWDSYEFSWGFKRVQIINNEDSLVARSYDKVGKIWIDKIKRLRTLEEENNLFFIDLYNLSNELNASFEIKDVTLFCNPTYRYSDALLEEEQNNRLQSDTFSELISYIIGCMMGRYSLDREGLVYAHAGNVGFNDLVAEGAYQSFAADGDGILPLTSEHWFEDDIAARIEEFVRTVWGADTLEENLQFIANSLCLYAIKPPKKGGETSRETIRRYLSTQFFKDHLKTYKKRPIYWLFSSGKEKAFECLVYLHRYNEATLPRMRTEYVTPLLGQMASRIERLRLQQADASTAEAKRLDKQIDGLTKQLAELRAFDDQLKHHADMKITLDLDVGVKVNYGRFGTLLSDVKAITGDKGE